MVDIPNRQWQPYANVVPVTYRDFTGGLNTETANDLLKDNEFPVYENADLKGRGSAKRRYGRRKIAAIPGNGQGLFFYYRHDREEPDLIVAISGKLYVKPYGSDTFSQIVITDGTEFVFQDSLPIEAAQYRTDLFVATGTRLVEITYDDLTAAYQGNMVVPYKPTVQEVINIGTNAIADNPATWIQEKEAPTVSIDGITSTVPVAAVNQNVTFTAHVKKPANIDVNYSFSWRKTGQGTFTYAKTNSPDNTVDLSFNEVGGYDIKAETNKKVIPVGTWDVSSAGSEGWINGVRGNSWDSADDQGCLVLQGTAVNAEDSSLKSWKDFSTPLDLSKGNTIEWWWTVFSQSTQYGMNDNEVQLKFYTQGKLNSPILTIGNKGGSGRGVGGSWQKETDTYDGSLTGMDKIVRVGIAGGKVSNNGTYIPGTTSWTIDSNDTTSRFDDIIIYESGTETSYTLENFQVSGVIDPSIDPETYKEIHTSRSIRLHWDRILLAKDNKYPGQMYISDLNNPRYFPTGGRIDFSLDRQEPITSIVRFLNFLVIFTKTSIHTLTGHGPDDFVHTVINNRIGCIAGNSAVVVKNNILFLSDDGIYSLVPNQYQQDILNVEPVDINIKSEIPLDPDAASIVSDDQYWISFPSISKVFRFYYDMGSWVKDSSSKLNIVDFINYTDDVYNLTSDGTVYLHDKTVHADDGEKYVLKGESKYLDLGIPSNFKRLRALYLMAKNNQDASISIDFTIQGDAPLNVTYVGNGEINPSADIEWEGLSGTMTLNPTSEGELPISVVKSILNGRCRRVKISFSHTEDQPCEILGFGFEFEPTML